MSQGEEEKEIGEAMELILDKIAPNSVKKVEEDHLLESLNFEKSILKSVYDEKVGVSFASFDLRSF
jgi:hypothetical protein